MKAKALAACLIFSLAFLFSPVLRGQEAWSPHEPIARDGDVIETSKHLITVGESGFADQFYIKADSLSLPLEARSGDMEPGERDLILLGRGPQFRSPLRLESLVEGVRAVAGVREAASVISETGGAVIYGSQLAAGPLQIDLESRYECDGAMLFDMRYSGGGEGVEVLELVLDLSGALSFAYRGLPGDFRADDFDRSSLDVSVPPDRDATVWTSADDWVFTHGAFVSYLLFGSHDRAFTWLAEEGGFAPGEETPMVEIERDELGRATVRIRIIGRESGHGPEGRVRFALFAHPSSPRSAGHNKSQWLSWAGGDAAPGSDGLEHVSLDLRDRLRAVAGEPQLTPLTAGSFESFARSYELRGHAGGAGVSADLDNVRLYPNSLFSVFAGPFRNRPARVVSNVNEIVSGGVQAGYDRQILGRALASGIGSSISGANQPVEHLRFVRSLRWFGLFDSDETELLPYWRNEGYIRYGEEWEADDPFALEEENPASGVYVTAYRRRFERDGRRGVHVLFIVMNENDHAVRQRLYILDPERVFGGLNQMLSREAAMLHDFSRIPAESDWRRERIESITSSHGGGPMPSYRDPRALRDLDLEGTGFVEHCPRQQSPPPEIYGPLFIYPRDFRMVYGYRLEE